MRNVPTILDGALTDPLRCRCKSFHSIASGRDGVTFRALLKSPSSDMISMSYSVEASGTSLTTRLSSQSLPSIKVPANGTTTTETIASTI